MSNDARIFDRLDPQQAEAVRHGDGPAIVVAGAGAGKTTVLTRRIANMIETGVDPSRIMLLTFTRASAKGMIDRAKRVSPAAAAITGGTFHSVATKIVRDNHRNFRLPANFTVLDPGDIEDVFRSLMAQDPFVDGGPQARTVAKIVSLAVNTQRGIVEVVGSKFSQWGRQADHVAKLSERYREYKVARNLLDFDDLLVCFAKFAEHPVTGPGLRDLYRHLLVDEHQDSNAIQLRIIYGMGGDRGNVMVVGDPSQSIYGFRGAEPGVMFDFRRRWPEAKTYLIETNYRSTPEIVACADAVDKSLAVRFERRLVAGRPSDGRKPTLISVADRETESERIASMVLERRDAGIGYPRQAVLVRSMRAARSVEVAFGRRGIPYVFMGGIRIHEAAHVRDLVAVLRILSNPSDEPAWIRFLKLFAKVGDKAASDVVNAFRPEGSLDDALATLRSMAVKKTVLAPPAVVLAEAAKSVTPHGVIAKAREALEPFLVVKWGDEWDWRRKDIDALAEIAAGYESIDDFTRAITIDVSVDKKREHSGAAVDEEGTMTISTVHSAKGLEWDVCYVPSFIEGHMPSMAAIANGELDEERRLFYVAVTRAKGELILVKPLCSIVKGREMPTSASSFEAVVRPHVEARTEGFDPFRSTALDLDAFVDFR